MRNDDGMIGGAHPADARGCEEPAGMRVSVLGIGSRSARAVIDAGRKLGVRIDELTIERFGTLGAGGHDVLIVAGGRGSVGEVCEAVEIACGFDAALTVIAAAGRASAEDVVAMVRSGASDVVVGAVDVAALADRLPEAVMRTRGARAATAREEALTRMCRLLEDEREESRGGEAGGDGSPGLNGLVAGFAEPSAAELFGGGDDDAAGNVDAGLDGELDVEKLLRGSLESLLDRIRPLNAAVFLPKPSGDFAVGAYVNADLDTGRVDEVLDHLADGVPAAVGDRRDVLRVRGGKASAEVLGEVGSWFGGETEMVLSACLSGGNVIAALAFFRCDGTGVTASEEEELTRFRAVFARRLARVVRVHNRTHKEVQWFGFDVGDVEGDGDAQDDWWRDAA